MSHTTAETYEQFTAEAGRYGVTVTETAPDSVAATISDAVDPPAVGTPLPWEGLHLPADVTTEITPAALQQAVTGVTPASLAIAEYGSVVLRMDDHASEPVSLFTDHHVAVLRAADIVADMTAAFDWFGEQLRDTRDSAIIATGPSATADMGSLVQGAHGPKTVEVIVVR